MNKQEAIAYLKERREFFLDKQLVDRAQLMKDTIRYVEVMDEFEDFKFVQTLGVYVNPHIKYINRDNLEIGQAYEVEARNFKVAIWTGENFAGLRYKLGSYSIEYEDHWDDGPPHGTVKPIRKLF